LVEHRPWHCGRILFRIDPANSPMGVGKGIYPGRSHGSTHPNATKWNGVTGNWWDEQNLDQQAVG